MIITTFNVRGLGGRVKRNKVKELVRLNNIDFLVIQETKMEEVSYSFCKSIWGSDDCEWAFLPSEGNSGGILSLWRKSLATVISKEVGEGFVCICLEWGVLKHKCVSLSMSIQNAMWRLRRLEEVVGKVIGVAYGDGRCGVVYFRGFQCGVPS